MKKRLVIIIITLSVIAVSALAGFGLYAYDRIGRMPFYDLHVSDVEKISAHFPTLTPYELPREEFSAIVYYLKYLRVGLPAASMRSFDTGETCAFVVQLTDGSKFWVQLGSRGFRDASDVSSYICYVNVHGKYYNCYDRALVTDLLELSEKYTGIILDRENQEVSP